MGLGFGFGFGLGLGLGLGLGVRANPNPNLNPNPNGLPPLALLAHVALRCGALRDALLQPLGARGEQLARRQVAHLLDVALDHVRRRRPLEPVDVRLELDTRLVVGAQLLLTGV